MSKNLEENLTLPFAFQPSALAEELRTASFLLLERQGAAAISAADMTNDRIALEDAKMLARLSGNISGKNEAERDAQLSDVTTKERAALRVSEAVNANALHLLRAAEIRLGAARDQLQMAKIINK